MGNRLSGLPLLWDIWYAGHGAQAGLARRQRTRLAALVAHARRAAPYYRHLYHDLPFGTCALRRLPPVTKSALMAAFDDWVTDPRLTRARVDRFLADTQAIGHLYQDRYAIWTTSGTTGRPGIFVHDRTALQVYTGLASLRFWPIVLGPHPLGQLAGRGFREAILVATGQHFAGVSFYEYARQTYPWLAARMRTFSVLDPLPRLVEALNAFQPTILAGYPTVLELLAGEQRAGRLHLRPVVITAAGEHFPAAARTAIAIAFACPVYDLYGSSEFLYLSSPCRYGRLHANTDWLILEPVDADYRPVPPGTPSHTVLLTNLANWVQPLIRYDLGDSITLAPGPCPCGNPLPVVTVIGRTDEILDLPGRDGTTIRVLPLALGTVVEQTPGIERWQVIQVTPAVLQVRLQVATGRDANAVWRAVHTNLHAYLTRQGACPVEIALAPESPQAEVTSGKFRHVWRRREVARPADPWIAPGVP